MTKVSDIQTCKDTLEGISTNEKEMIPSEERILQAAEKEFMEKGFAGARTTSIAEAAGVTHAMLHYYFRTKEKLFEQIMTKKLSEIIKVLLISLDSEEGTVIERITKAVGLHFDFVRANPEMPHFVLTEIFASPIMLMRFTQNAKEYSQGMFRGISNLIKEGVEKGECRQVDPWNLLLDIISLNLIVFAGMPLLKTILIGDGDVEKFLDERRKNNIETIIKKLQP